MIGLLFLGCLIAWIAIALTLGIKLPKWLGIQRFKPWVSVLLVLFIFFMPVADEIIAWPQMQALCESVKTYRYDKAMATEKTVSKFAYVLSRKEKILFPRLPVTVTEYGNLGNNIFSLRLKT